MPDLNQLSKDLNDQWWRLNNLYYILDDQGRKILFEPEKRPVQRDIYRRMHSRNIYLKSRQHGVTTFKNTFFLDCCLFNENVSATIIADTLDNAKRFLREKIKFAYENIRIPEIKNEIQLVDDNKQELSFSNNSRINVSTSARSTTAQLIHISEFGKIATERPTVAQEIISGCIPAVSPINTIISIESTAEGNFGEFYDLWNLATRVEAEGKKLSSIDFKPFFYPWYKKPECALSDYNGIIPRELKEYFEELNHKHKIILSDEQKHFYVKTYEVLQDNMTSQYPSFADEAFQSANLMAYYKKQMFKLRQDKRLEGVLYDPNLYTHTAWDLGISDSMAIVFFQLKGDFINIIDYIECNDEDIVYYIDLIKSKPYKYGTHFAPHDINKRDLLTKKTRLQRAQEEYGLKFQKLPQSKSVIEDINLVRRNFYRVRVNSEKCDRLIQCLDGYQKKWNTKYGVPSNMPADNEFIHGADAFRYMVLSLEFLEKAKISFNNLIAPVYNTRQTSGGWMR